MELRPEKSDDHKNDRMQLANKNIVGTLKKLGNIDNSHLDARLSSCSLKIISRRKATSQ